MQLQIIHSRQQRSAVSPHPCSHQPLSLHHRAHSMWCHPSSLLLPTHIFPFLYLFSLFFFISLFQYRLLQNLIMQGITTLIPHPSSLIPHHPLIPSSPHPLTHTTKTIIISCSISSWPVSGGDDDGEMNPHDDACIAVMNHTEITW